MERINWERWAAVIFCGLGAVLIFYLFFRYAVGIFLPFLVGCALGATVRRPAEALSRRTGISRKALGVILFLLVVLIICLIVFFAAQRMVGELGRLVESLAREEGAFDGLGDYVSNLTERLPLIRDIRARTGNEDFWEGIDGAVTDAVRGMASELGAALPRMAGQAVTALPGAFVFIAVAIISGFFFASGSVSLATIVRHLPNRMARRAEGLRKRASAALGRWFRAYLLILGLTFVELFIGFSVIGVNYAFLAAIGVALVDILPIFGAGTVLVPWGAIELLSGNRFVGFGLLVIWAVISVVRQFAEPRIVGKSLGVSPILALLAMYGGFKLFGVGGMIVSPAVIILVRAFVEEGRASSEEQGSEGGAVE